MVGAPGSPVGDTVLFSRPLGLTNSTRTPFIMPSKSDLNKTEAGNFRRSGPYAARITEWLKDQALQAQADGKSPAEGDFEWETFAAARPELVEVLVKEFPAKPTKSKGSDIRKNARQILSGQRDRFKKFLVTGAGKSFLLNELLYYTLSH